MLGGGVNNPGGNEYTSGGNRRGSLMASRSASSHTSQQLYNYGLQLDIERMFSRKIKIFDLENLQLSAESILGTILKVSRPITKMIRLGWVEIRP